MQDFLSSEIVVRFSDGCVNSDRLNLMKSSCAMSRVVGRRVVCDVRAIRYRLDQLAGDRIRGLVALEIQLRQSD